MTEKVNPFTVEKSPIEQWQDRLGDSYWQLLHRSSLIIEELDRRLCEEDSPCANFQSQKQWLPFALALVSVLDRDDFLYLPKEISLASIHRGLAIEQYIGQYLGNVLDHAKGRLAPGNVSSEAFHILPNLAPDTLEQAIGVGLAMKVRGHAKIVALPIMNHDLINTKTFHALQAAKKLNSPVLFFCCGKDASKLAKLYGLRSQLCEAQDFLSLLKFLKTIVERVRQKKEACVVSIPNAISANLSELLLEFLERKSLDIGSIDELHTQVKEEVQYGIERAVFMPAPSAKSTIYDLREKVSLRLESDWKEWSKSREKTL